MEIPFRTVLNTHQDINQLLIEADMTLINRRRNAMAIGQAHLKIFRRFPEIGFRFIEKRYRSFGSQTFLLSAPASKLPPGLKARTLDGKHSDYWIWIEVNGVEAAVRQMAQWTLDHDTNLERLDLCGFATVISDNPTSSSSSTNH